MREILENLAELFDQIDLIWCDNPNEEIYKSENYQKLIKLFPNLQKIHQKGLEDNQSEFNRTMKHIFRCFKIYYLLKQGNFEHESLSIESLRIIKQKIEKISNLNELFIPLIIMYHDIGRFYDRKTHAYQSSALISNNGLFNRFELSEEERLLLRKVIEYHLFFPTIYTGESTFFGVISLLNDKEFIKLIQDKRYITSFIDFLETFTYLDILGYTYARMFDHYLKYYNEINLKLKDLLNLWPELKKILSLAKQYSMEWTDWRLSGALRIFQFVETKPYLTKAFYYNVLKESIQLEYKKRGQKFNWTLIKSNLSNIYKFQMKYALAFLLILAFGQITRMKLTKDQKISPKLMLFWIYLSEEVNKRKLDNKEVVWNIYFENLPFWADIDQNFIAHLKITTLKSIIHAAKLKFDEIKKEYNLYLDFDQI
ncbi:MAG: hypothetical protein ACFFD2_03220 [Promethearchaeota archaeon]